MRNIALLIIAFALFLSTNMQADSAREMILSQIGCSSGIERDLWEAVLSEYTQVSADYSKIPFKTEKRSISLIVSMAKEDVVMARRGVDRYANVLLNKELTPEHVSDMALLISYHQSGSDYGILTLGIYIADLLEQVNGMLENVLVINGTIKELATEPELTENPHLFGISNLNKRLATESREFLDMIGNLEISSSTCATLRMKVKRIMAYSESIEQGMKELSASI